MLPQGSCGFGDPPPVLQRVESSFHSLPPPQGFAQAPAHPSLGSSHMPGGCEAKLTQGNPSHCCIIIES